MDTITKGVFLITNIRHKEKIQWIKRIINSQLGVTEVSVNPSNMLMKVEYDPAMISPRNMQILVRSVGCGLLIDEKKIHDRLRQKSRIKRDTISFILTALLFGVSFFTWKYEWGYIAVTSTGILFLTSLIVLIVEQRRIS
ncbi:hypothetical protein [Bacteroides sedimenti]|uniref:hypothetical protein n=1 Tax=Bacteroides sedimenti TaxID=2136147 RepID=UPI0033427625